MYGIIIPYLGAKNYYFCLSHEKIKRIWSYLCHSFIKFMLFEMPKFLISRRCVYKCFALPSQNVPWHNSNIVKWHQKWKLNCGIFNIKGGRIYWPSGPTKMIRFRLTSAFNCPINWIWSMRFHFESFNFICYFVFQIFDLQPCT